MAAEKDLKTKIGLSKSLTRSHQNRGVYADVTQFDSTEFQQIIGYLRQLNELEQQLLLSAQEIVYRGTLSGFKVERIQQILFQVTEFLEAVDQRITHRTTAAPKRSHTEADADEDLETDPADPEVSVDNVTEFFGGDGSLDAQVEERQQQAAAGAAKNGVFYYQERTFADGERVILRYTSPDFRASQLAGVHIRTEQELAEREISTDRSEMDYETEAGVLARYRRAIEELQEASVATAAPALSLDEDSRQSRKGRGGRSKKTETKSEPDATTPDDDVEVN